MSDYEVVAQSGGGGGMGGWGAIAGIVSGLLDSVIGPVAANQEKGWASRAARHQRSWAEMMSSTSYQRAVKDLQAAGLNPALAYMQGGATSPGGAMASTPNIDMPSFSDISGRAVSNAKTSALLGEQVRTLRAQRMAAENEAEASRRLPEKMGVEIGESLMRTNALEAQGMQAVANKKNLDMDTTLRGYDVPAAKAGAELYEDYGSEIKATEKVLDIIGQGAGIGGRFLSGAARGGRDRVRRRR